MPLIYFAGAPPEVDKGFGPNRSLRTLRRKKKHTSQTQKTVFDTMKTCFLLSPKSISLSHLSELT